MTCEDITPEQQAILDLSAIILRLEATLRENTQALHLMVEELKRLSPSR